jgi:hypothetical protein
MAYCASTSDLKTAPNPNLIDFQSNWRDNSEQAAALTRHRYLGFLQILPKVFRLRARGHESF